MGKRRQKPPASAPEPPTKPPLRAGQTGPFAPQPAPLLTTSAPHFDAIVRRYGDTSATIRPRVQADAGRAGADVGEDPLDLIVHALWQVVSSAQLAPHPSGARGAALGDVAADPIYWLDALLSAQQEAAFPYPTSPRWDGVGGGRRVAEDGSPGLPGGWLSWLLSSASAADGGAQNGGERRPDEGARVVALAVGRVSRRLPEAWRVYREYVTTDAPPRGATQGTGQGPQRNAAEVARRLRLPAPRVRRLLAQARAALTTEIAYLSGLIDAGDRDATRATLDHLYASLRVGSTMETPTGGRVTRRAPIAPGDKT